MWKQKPKVKFPKSSGIGQNLREWWVGEKNFCKQMAMQSNCHGPSIVVKQAKKNNGLRRQGARGNLNFLALPRERNVRLAIMLSSRISCAGQTPLFSSYADIICGKPD
jgi:hypothetical protein